MMAKTRTTLLGAGALAVAALLAGCAGGGEAAPTGTSGPNAEPVTITFVAYGGVGQEAMINDWQQPFTAENPHVTFINTAPSDVAQVKAQVENNAVQWDVMAMSPAAAQENCGILFEKLDMSGLNTDDLVDEAVGECYVGNFVNATPLAYRTDAFPDPDDAPKTLADFFDKDGFPGQRGVITNLQNGILEYPLLADGVAPDDLYPLDVDRALDIWDGIRDITTFAPNVGALQQAVGADQVDLFLLSDSRIAPLIDEGKDITIVWDITVTSVNAFGVPKGSTKLATTEEFLKFVTEPEQAAAISESLGVAPISKAAKPNLTGGAAAVAVYSDVNTGETVMQNIQWYADNFNDVTTKLTNWLAG